MMPKNLTYEQLLLLVDDLLELEVLELIPSTTDPSSMYIPYMMNDAVEYYLILRNCQVMGKIPKEFDGDSRVKLVDTPGRPGMIFDMPTGEKLTLWFDRCEAVREFYQYHTIGHFGPFRYYSPIDEPLDDRYPESEAGWDCMRALALKAGDTDYVRRMDRANVMRKLPFIHPDAVTRSLANALNLPARKKLFEYIYRRFCEASALYPRRDYDETTRRRMRTARRQVTKALHDEGFAGDYPLFNRGGTCALATEEHPFLIQELDYEGFAFRITLMVSESETEGNGPFAGFFAGGRSGLRRVYAPENEGKPQR